MTGENGRPQEMTVLLTKYVDWRRTHNATENSVGNSKRVIRAFITWAADRGIRNATEVSRQHIEEYQHHLAKLKAVTQSTYTSILRSWFQWLARNGHIPYCPHIDLPHDRDGSHVFSIHDGPAETETSQETERPKGTKEPQKLTVLLDQFSQWLTDHNATTAHVGRSRRSVKRFVDWAEEQGVTKTNEITEDTLERYRQHLAERPQAFDTSKPLKTHSQITYVGIVRTWLQWLARYNHIPFPFRVEAPHKRTPKDELAEASAMKKLLDEFSHWLRIHNFSESSIVNTRRGVMGFIAWTARQGITEASQVNRTLIEQYQCYLHERLNQKTGDKRLKARTQSGYLASVQAFFNWLARSNQILYSPATDIELPRYPKRLPKAWLSANEAEQILALPDVDTPLGVRDRAILETLYSTGVRRMEVIHLTLSDLDTERGVVVVREGKGGKDRVVPIGERALGWISRYVKDVRPRLIRFDRGMDSLFLTFKGGPFAESAMTELIHKYVVAGEVGKSGACHLWRHTMATVMHENGADIRDIQAILGHESVETTGIYTKVAIGKLKKVHTATHPARPTEEP